MIWFFSDKNFCQDQVVNSQNNYWLAVCSKDLPKAMQTKFPATVMVFGVVLLRVMSCCCTVHLLEGLEGQHGGVPEGFGDARTALDT